MNLHLTGLWAQWIGAPLAILGAIAGVVLALRERRAGSASPAIAGARPWSWALAASFAVAAFLALHGWVSIGSFGLVGGDEYCRADYALKWAESPFFAPADHIWLAGQFYILGGLFRLVGDIQLVCGATAILGMALAVLLAASLGRRAWGDPVAGFFAGLFLACHPVVLWGSMNPFAEVFALPALLGGFDCWLAGWQARRRVPAAASEGGPERPPLCPELWFLAAAAWLAFGTMFRFEAWFAGIALGAFLAIRAAWWLIARRSFGRAWPSLAGCALLMAYPLAWMASSWRHLGSPTAFLTNASQMNIEGNKLGLYDFSTPLARLATYPTILWEDHWPWLATAIGAAILALYWRPRRALPLVGAWLALMAVAMLVAMKSGIGSNFRPRYSMFLLLAPICLAGGLFAALWRLLEPMGRFGVVARAAIVAAALLFAKRATEQARVDYPDAFGYSSSMLGWAARLDTESAGHRPDARAIWPAGAPMAMLFARPEDWWLLRYHSGRPRELGAIWSEEQLRGMLAEWPVGGRLLIRSPVPDFPFPPRAKPLEKSGGLELWAIVEEPAVDTAGDDTTPPNEEPADLPVAAPAADGETSGGGDAVPS
jgi:hypothetical protein